MKKRNTFQTTSLFYLLTGLATVMALGFLAYANLSEIMETVNAAGRPDLSLAQMKEIQSDILEAENSVYTYSISRDESYLAPYYTSAQSIYDKMNTLQVLNRSSREKTLLTDSLDLLIVEKIGLLKETLELQTGDRVDEALQQVDKKVRQIRPQSSRNRKGGNDNNTGNTDPENMGSGTQSADSTEEGQKRGFIKRIFSKKENGDEEPEVVATVEEPKEESDNKRKRRRRRNQEPEEETVAVAAPAPDVDSIMQVRTQSMKRELRAEISRVNMEDDKKVAAFLERQLELNAANEVVSAEIRGIADQLEALERAAIRARAEDAERMARATNQLIIGFCIAAGLLLLLLGYGIFDYLRKNNRYQRALLGAQKAATDLAATRERFLANMSHELRTPLNAIAGFTDQVLKSTLNEDQHDQLQVVRQSSDHLLGILNSILDFSRLQSDKVKLENRPFDPRATVELVVRLMRLEAKKKKIGFRYEPPASFPPALVGDELRIRQILFNLLSNAIKFTEQGEVGLKISYEMEGKDRLKMTFVVYDTGIGIPAEKQATIFRPFEQAEDSTSRRYGGTGLGLAISHELIQLHQGDIALVSAPNEGTRITFHLPYLIADPKQLPQTTTNIKMEKAPFRNKKALIVDDEPYNRLLVRALLEQWKVAYDEAGTGGEATRKMQEVKYDIVLMDLQLPDGNGMDIVRKLRAGDGVNQQTAVIAMTAATGPDVEAACREAGMNGNVPKPFSEMELYQRMGEIWSNDASEEVATDTMEDKGNLSLEPLMKLSRGNHAFVQDLTLTFINNTKENLQAMQDQPDNWDQIGLLAHRMAAPSKHLGATHLYGLLKQLEKEADGGQNEAVRDRLLEKIQAESKRVTIFLEAELVKMS